MAILLEVCTDSPSGAVAAAAGGADRIELCAALELGGVTPSAGLLSATLALCKLPVVALARPRAGDFVYDSADYDALRRDVISIREAGAQGVAVGVLEASGAIDVVRMRELVELARPLEVCCHRAFDWTPDQREALEVLCRIGVHRVLTSGGAALAEAGVHRIASLVDQGRGRIDVLVGGGVRPHNAARIVAATGVRQLHFSARGRARSPQRPPDPPVPLGATRLPDDFELRPTEVARVRAVRAALSS